MAADFHSIHKADMKHGDLMELISFNLVNAARLTKNILKQPIIIKALLAIA